MVVDNMAATLLQFSLFKSAQIKSNQLIIYNKNNCNFSHNFGQHTKAMVSLTYKMTARSWPVQTYLRVLMSATNLHIN